MIKSRTFGQQVKFKDFFLKTAESWLIMIGQLIVECYGTISTHNKHSRKRTLNFPCWPNILLTKNHLSKVRKIPENSGCHKILSSTVPSIIKIWEISIRINRCSAVVKSLTFCLSYICPKPVIFLDKQTYCWKVYLKSRTPVQGLLKKTYLGLSSKTL